MATFYELKEKMATLSAQIDADTDWITEKAANPETDKKEISEKTAHRDDLESRYQLLKSEHDKMEAAQRAEIEKKAAKALTGNKEVALKTAKGEFYRAAILGDEQGKKKAYEGLGAIPANSADMGYGDKLLPTNLSSELITDPVVENPMRTVERVSNITGLEEPKLLFTIDGTDYNDVVDFATANEIESTGDSIVYGRHKVKVYAAVSDTVLHGSALDIQATVDGALRSGLAQNELNRQFAATPASGYEAMSFYSTQNAVPEIEGVTLQAAIGAALADLPLAYRRNAKIVMSATDWYDMWSANLNQSGTFYEERPLSLFGKQVVLVDDATSPIVGDFSYARINYDEATTYDVDKDVKTGTYLFVLTAWYDIKLRLSSAFRVATVANP
jgi:HK97 family phage major capsid protein